MKYNKLLAVLAVPALLLTACSTNEQKTQTQTQNQSSSHSHSEKSHSYKTMTGADLQKMQEDDKEKEKYIVVDVRSAEEYKQGHLKHAINIPVADVANHIERLSSAKGKKSIVLYCHHEKMSITVADALKADGHTDLIIAQGVKDYTDYKFVKYANVLGVDFQKELSSGKVPFTIDARDEKDFNTSHASGAINVDVKNLDGLEAKLPAEKDALIYTYCYSGNRSAKVAQKLVDLGYTNVVNATDGTKEFEYKF